MRILCTVCVVDRKFSIQQSRKFIKSTLAVCKQPKSEKDFCVLLFNCSNKNGTKYMVNNNVSNILTRFIHEGKATIQFKVPEHDVFVQAEDATQLKHVLVLLKKILEGKLSANDMKVSTIGVTALNHNSIAPKKLCIKNRSEYPLKGFPKTLEVLQINDVRRLSFDHGILKLVHLRVLDLSNNIIEVIPEDINKLGCLVEINLSGNQLGASAPRKWDWMGGRLSMSLQSLNLSNNRMKYVPNQVTRLHNLIQLDVSGNAVKSLPSGIGNVRSLKILLAGKNHLVSVPGSIKKLQLELLDLSANDFDTENADRLRFDNAAPKPLPMQTLREHSGNRVLQDRLFYSKETLPMTLISFLETARYCACGRACFDNFIEYKDVLFLPNITTTIQMTGRGSTCVPVDLCFCSMPCFRRSNRRLRLIR